MKRQKAKTESSSFASKRPKGKHDNGTGVPFSRRRRMGWEFSAVTGLMGPVMTADDMHAKYGKEELRSLVRIPVGGRNV